MLGSADLPGVGMKMLGSFLKKGASNLKYQVEEENEYRMRNNKRIYLLCGMLKQVEFFLFQPIFGQGQVIFLSGLYVAGPDGIFLY